MTEAEKMAITKYDLYYEARMTKMETISEEMKEDIKQIKGDMRSDFRWLFGLQILVCGIMAHGFKWF